MPYFSSCHTVEKLVGLNFNPTTTPAPAVSPEVIYAIAAVAIAAIVAAAAIIIIWLQKK